MSAPMHQIRRGRGKPLLLIHGLGGTWRSWTPILDRLAAERSVIAIDLPGHGETPALLGATTFRGLTDHVAQFLRTQKLEGIDIAGSSMGARLVLELVRRGGLVGNAVALDPGGFWRGWERHAFASSLRTSVALLRGLRPVLPGLSHNPVSRSVLLAQFSARPWRLSPAVVLDELRSYALCPVFDELLHDLAYGEEQQGLPRGSLRAPLVIAWGRHDRVTLARQATRAAALFPDARVQWFEHAGHFPHWDEPAQVAEVILDTVSLPKRQEASPELDPPPAMHRRW